MLVLPINFTSLVLEIDVLTIIHKKEKSDLDIIHCRVILSKYLCTSGDR